MANSVRRVYDFSGGLNSATPSFLMQEKQCPVFHNVWSDIAGRITPIKSYDKRLPDEFASGIDSLYAFEDNSSTLKILIQSNNNLYVNGNSTVLKSGLSSNKLNYIYFRDSGVNKAYCFNGVDQMFKTDGSTVANVTSNLSNIAVVHGRKIFTNDVNNPLRLWHSANFTDTGLNTQYVDIAADPDEKITGFLSNGTFLVVMLKKTAMIMTGKSDAGTDFRFYNITIDDGCVAPYSIAKIGGKFFYLGNSGIYKFNGSYATNVSYPIKDFLLDVTETEKAKAHSSFFGDYYVVTLKNKYGDIRTYFYNVYTNFWLSSSLDIVTSCNIKGNTNNRELLFSNSNYVYEFDSGSGFDSNNILSIIQHKDESLSIPERTGLLKELWLSIKGTGIAGIDIITDKDIIHKDIDLADFDFGITIWGSGTWGSGTYGTGKSKLIKIPLPAIRSKKIAFRLSFDDKKSFEFNGYSVIIEKEDIK